MRFSKVAFVIILLFPFAPIWGQDIHLLRMVNCINSSDFKCASEELHLIKDWTEKKYLDDSRSMDFFDFLDSIEVADELLDSLLIYFADDADIKFEYYFDLGYYQRAINYEDYAANFYSIVYGNNHSAYARSLNKLGVAYTTIGNFEKAEEYYNKSLHVRRNLYGLMHPDYIRTLVNLGGLYGEMGDIHKAESYYLVGLNKYRNLHDKNYPDYKSDYVSLLINIGCLYSDIGEYEKSKEYLIQAQQMYKMNIDLHKDTLEYAHFLNSLGSMYLENEDYSQAITTLLEAKKITEEYNKIYNLSYSTTLNLLAVLYNNIGRFDKAETYLLQSLQVYKEKPYIKERGYLNLLHNLVMIHYRQNNLKKAEEFANLEYSECKELIKNSLNFMTEKQRSNYINIFLSSIEWIPCISYVGYREKPALASLAYNCELTIKGLLLQMDDAVNTSIINSKDISLIQKWERLKYLKHSLQNLLELDPNSMQRHGFVQDVEMLEKNITLASSEYRKNIHQWNITCDSVQNSLKPNQVAIEYMVAPLNEDSTMYCALLLRRNYKYPKLIPLFEEKKVTTLLNTSSGDTAQINSTYIYNKNGKLLSRLIWDKVKAYVKEGEDLYFAPTGILHQIAIENLPYDENHTMGEIYNIQRLSSTRNLVLHKQSITPTSAALFGGINYDATPEDLYAHRVKPIEDEEDKQPDNTLIAYNTKRDRDSKGPLPGTKIEVREIDKVLTEANVHVQRDTAEIATEEAFMALSGKHKHIIHLATHGFYWQDSTAQNEKYFTQRAITMDNNNIPKSIDPLERCGLLFAGASTALKGKGKRLEEYGVQDGVLTAKEISTMDLRDAELVVLSACETGLGDITGDGVFGLQRAFKMAGAKTIIMSLWKVDDHATQLLMSEFYKNWVASKGKLSKREAFRKAQNEVRSRYSNPVYWAGFIILD